MPDPGDRWHHFAVCNSPDRTRLYLDGKLNKSHPPLGLRTRKSFSNLYLGPSEFTYHVHVLHADIRAVRISSTIRYTRDFVPPARLEKDANTLVLLDFSVGKGNRLPDLSGRGHHGRIVGADWIKIEVNHKPKRGGTGRS